MKSQLPLFVYKKGIDENSPVMRLLFNNIIECNYFLLLRYSTFFLYDPTPMPIGRDHGTSEKVYKIKPIPKELMFDATLILDFIRSPTNSLSNKEDFQLGNFPPYKIELIKDEYNNFIEREKSNSPVLLENVFLHRGELLFGIYNKETNKSTNYFAQKIKYKRGEFGYLNEKIVESKILTPNITIGNTQIETIDNDVNYKIHIQRNGTKLFNEYIIKEFTFEMLIKAIEFNEPNDVKLILQDKNVDPLSNNNQALKLISDKGRVKIFKLFMKDGRVDPSVLNNYAIAISSQEGHTEMVRLLLQDKRVDPSVENNYAISKAAQFGHTEIVRLLKEDERIDSSSINTALSIAVMSKQIEVVKLLLQDKRINSLELKTSATIAAYRGYNEILELLLQDERIDTSIVDSYIFRFGKWLRSWV